MPECIVCKGYYEAGRPCGRCGADNRAWEDWQRGERNTRWPLLRFLALHFYMPWVIAGWALLFGLIGIVWPWGGVKPPFLVLAILLTVVLSVLTAQDVYAARYALREDALLQRVRRGKARRAGAARPALAFLAPAIAIVVTGALTVLLVRSSFLWELADWFVFDDSSSASQIDGTPEQEHDLSTRERVVRAFPLMCLIAYVSVPPTLAYYSSTKVAEEYARRLNERVPQPIFMREALLVDVVRREAEHIAQRGNPLEESRHTGTSATMGLVSRVWTWDEMDRRDDGGVRMTAVVADTKEEESITGQVIKRSVRTVYEVQADAWGCITSVSRKE